MVGVEFGRASDYAYLRSGDLEFHYGPVKIKEEFQWRMIVNEYSSGKAEEIYRITSTDIKKECSGEIFEQPIDWLLAGIGLFMEGRGT